MLGDCAGVNVDWEAWYESVYRKGKLGTNASLYNFSRRSRIESPLKV